MIIKPDLKNGILSLSEEIKNAIQGRSTKLIEKDRVILILVDGLGYSLAQKIGFQAERIHSVFPTITITVITTLLTSQPPGVHGIMGWRILDKENGRIVNLLKEDSEIRVSTYLGEKDLIVSPSYNLATKFYRKLGNVVTYSSPWESVTLTLEMVERNNPNFVFLYLPYVDSVSHRFGPNSIHTMETARETVNLASKLAEKLEQRYSVVITADHGHVPVEGVVKLDKDLLNYVDLPPYGDHRNLMFMSRRDPSDYLSAIGLITLNREELTKITGGPNVPDYAAVPTDNRVYMYWEDEEATYVGTHGGMSKDEMEIPLKIYQK
ncbi:MAG: alkaline phosphatase family protein [Metallosphaera sp.]